MSYHVHSCRPVSQESPSLEALEIRHVVRSVRWLSGCLRNKIENHIYSTLTKLTILNNNWCFKSFKMYRCVKYAIDRREADANSTFHTPINLDIGLFKHQVLFFYYSVSNGWLILSRKRRSVIPNLESPN